MASSGQSAAHLSDLASPSAIGRGWKRGLDLVLSLMLLVILAPLMAGIALAIRRSDRGPILFRHERIGFGGHRFHCWKFRSMVVHAEARLDELIEADPDAASEWAARRKLSADPRVTALGRFLRQWSLDELPQLWNVIVGEMSLVGPRPIATAEIHHYAEDFNIYASARPGITGLWQVRGRNDCTYAQRIAFDIAYVGNWSMRADLAILLRTVYVVIARKGSG